MSPYRDPPKETIRMRLGNLSTWAWPSAAAIGFWALVGITGHLADCVKNDDTVRAAVEKAKVQNNNQCRDVTVHPHDPCPYPGQMIENTYHAETFICRCAAPAASASAPTAAETLR